MVRSEGRRRRRRRREEESHSLHAFLSPYYSPSPHLPSSSIIISYLLPPCMTDRDNGHHSLLMTPSPPPR